MRKFYVLVLSAMFALGPMAAVAEELPAEEEETVDTRASVMVDDHIGAGGYIKMNKTFNNSLVLGGDKIIDESKVPNGIGLFAGHILDLSGNYEYGIHAAGEMKITSKYERDLFAVGGKIYLAKEAEVMRDAFLAGEDIGIFADIHGDALIAAKKIVLSDVVIDGDLKTAAKNIDFRGDVVIKGEFAYSDQSVITGKFEAAKTSTFHSPFIGFEINGMVLAFFNLASSIVILLVFLFFVRNFSRRVVNDAEKYSGNDIVMTLFGGLAAAIVLPVVSALLLITIIGVPAGLILLLAWVLLLVISSTATAIFIAARVMPKMNTIVASILVLLLFAVFSMVPYLNIACTICEVCFGLGLIAKGLFIEKKA
ncbi:hypothetical protein J6T21_01115 [Candidatus Saccharibacteria bacterium]|nr:hypothetical protein [Candidatus Saccharibacteria bacterium]